MNKLKLGAKIGAGFGLLILISIMLGGLAVINMTSAGGNAHKMAEEYVPEVAIANEMERSARSVMLEIRGYQYTSEKKYLDLARKNLEAMRKALGQAKELSAKAPHLTKLKESVGKLEGKIAEWGVLVNDTEVKNEAIVSARAAMNEAAARFRKATQDFHKTQADLMIQEVSAGFATEKLVERARKVEMITEIVEAGNAVRVENWRSQALRDTKTMQEALKLFEVIDKKIAELQPISRVPANQLQLKDIQVSAQSYRQGLQSYITNWNAMLELEKKRIEVAYEAVNTTLELATGGMDNTKRLADESNAGLAVSTWVMIVGLIIAIILGVIVAIIIARGIVKPVQATVEAVGQAAEGDFSFSVEQVYLKRGDELGAMMRDVNQMADRLSTTITEVSQAAETVSSSASEISQGNQDLSERTQQQASAIEETASAVEQATSSIKQNAANAQQANQLAKKTRDMAQEGGAVLERTVTAMGAVTESSKKIAEIIGVVNEIAFQTNLLALNAAVEAARAGEAGRGFAVVAGEVRNLAGRSAQAAKEIQSLITDSVTKVEQGNDLVAESGRLLSDIIVNVQAVADTIGEISAASQEQATGIDEINKAVTQMDQAVQQNAALVEEAASASENMAAAAEELRSQMRQFKARGSMSGPTKSLPSPAPRPAAPRLPAAKPAARPAAKPAAKAASAAKKPAKDDFFDSGDMEGFEEF